MGITMVFDFFNQASMSGQVETGRRMGQSFLGPRRRVMWPIFRPGRASRLP
jgi:hypothetical protein